jgi:hypothetical protein
VPKRTFKGGVGVSVQMRRSELKGVVGSNVESEEKSLRIGVHPANAVVWGPVR